MHKSWADPGGAQPWVVPSDRVRGCTSAIPSSATASNSRKIEEKIRIFRLCTEQTTEPWFRPDLAWGWIRETWKSCEPCGYSKHNHVYNVYFHPLFMPPIGIKLNTRPCLHQHHDLPSLVQVTEFCLVWEENLPGIWGKKCLQVCNLLSMVLNYFWGLLH